MPRPHRASYPYILAGTIYGRDGFSPPADFILCVRGAYGSRLVAKAAFADFAEW